MSIYEDDYYYEESDESKIKSLFEDFDEDGVIQLIFLKFTSEDEKNSFYVSFYIKDKKYDCELIYHEGDEDFPSGYGCTFMGEEFENCFTTEETLSALESKILSLFHSNVFILTGEIVPILKTTDFKEADIIDSFTDEQDLLNKIFESNKDEVLICLPSLEQQELALKYCAKLYDRTVYTLECKRKYDGRL